MKEKKTNRAMLDAYNQDEEFRNYVDAYAEGRQIDVRTALEHKVVWQVLNYRGEMKNGRRN